MAKPTKHDERGREIPDQTPVAVNFPYKPPSQEEMIAKAVAEEFSRRAEQSQEFETLEEANDFGELDDDETLSQYELHEMHEEFLNSDAPQETINTEETPHGSERDPSSIAHPTTDASGGEAPQTNVAPQTQQFNRRSTDPQNPRFVNSEPQE